MKDIFKLQELKFYYKFTNNKLPYYLQTLPFNSNTNNTHNHNTRTQYNTQQRKPNHEYARKCLHYDIPIVINSTSLDII